MDTNAIDAITTRQEEETAMLSLSRTRSRFHPVRLLICFLLVVYDVNALVPLLPSRTAGGLRHHAPWKPSSSPYINHRVLVGPRHIKTIITKEESKAPPFIRRFFKNLSTGILYAIPMKKSFTEALFGIQSKRKNDKKNPAPPSVSFTLRECFLSIGVYILLGVLAYSIMMEHWSLVDAVYFSITTFTTVGYGDEFPRTTASKIFTCLFSLGGIAFLGAALASIGATLVEAELNAVNTAKRVSRKRAMTIYDRMPRVLKRNGKTPANSNVTAVVKFDATDAVAPPAAPKTVWETVRSVIWKLIPSFTLLLMGGVAIGRLEGWSWIDSMYYAVITAGTVGLGDYSPQRQVTRMCAILFVPFAVAAGEIFSEQSRRLCWSDEECKSITSSLARI